MIFTKDVFINGTASKATVSFSVDYASNEVTYTLSIYKYLTTKSIDEKGNTHCIDSHYTVTTPPSTFSMPILTEDNTRYAFNKMAEVVFNELENNKDF